MGSGRNYQRIRIYTNGIYKGVQIGKYKVVVTKKETEPSKLPPAPPSNDPAYAAWLQKSESEVRQSYSVIEKKYGDAKTTPYEIEITAEKSVTETFDVGKKVKY
jgi:hypothetical protein